jgi:capsular polysaccharide export protein
MLRDEFELTQVDENPALKILRESQSVLLLQGPVGAFFDRLAHWLMQQGTQVYRVAFQGGDMHDCQVLAPIEFKQSFLAWPAFLRRLLQEHQVDCVVIFGQTRHYHQVAVYLCKSIGLPVVVLEEGYFWPGFVTMELGGVNGNSDTLSNFKWCPLESPGVDGGSAGTLTLGIKPDSTPHHFKKMALQASLHYRAMWSARHSFIDYQHHRISQPSYYMTYWALSWLRKLMHLPRCTRLQRQLIAGKTRSPYYFVPLQRNEDPEITHQSDFSGNTEFVFRVMQSFARHAPPGTLLVFKQHPHTRGGPGHGETVAVIAQELGISRRVLHLVEGDTPELAEHSAGVVLINSPIGLQALERGAPLIVLGNALYKQPQLTFTGELDHFWRQARPACPTATTIFLTQLQNLTQAPVSFYALRNEPISWNAAEHKQSPPEWPHGAHAAHAAGAASGRD